jgi:hypothetical protein
MFAPGISIDLISIINRTQGEDVFQISARQVTRIPRTRPKKIMNLTPFFKVY